MSKQHIEELLQSALNTLQLSTPSIQIETTKDKQHGDFASNIALTLAKVAQCKPRELAEKIRQALPPSSKIANVEIAGPGFINFFLTTDALHTVITDILIAGEHYGRADIGKNKKVLLEFVSTNPNGPLHVGHGRHAAYGAVVAELLATVGYQVTREYYVNDAGRQMDILAVSVWLRYLTLCKDTLTFPANAYKGEYVIDIAQALLEKYQRQFVVPIADIFSDLPLDEPQGGDKEIYIDAVIVRAKQLLGDKNFSLMFEFSLESILKDIREDLEEFGVHFDRWFSERELTTCDAVNTIIGILKTKGMTYEREGALWFRSTDFNDEKDRVLERSNGQRTYFANDLAYHFNKFERGFDLAIDVLGSDHHGYIPRIKAGLQALGVSPEKLDCLLGQFVTLYRGGQQVQMSTRSGSFVTLRELRMEVGNDAARFFYVMRKREQHIDFDLDLAKSHSNENPVYYVQYAHARICSVWRQLNERGWHYSQDQGIKNLDRLVETSEVNLINTLSRYSEMLQNAAKQYDPHLLTNYLRDLATDFHAYYNNHAFLVTDEILRNARLVLVSATRQILTNGLKLLGVSAPDSM